MRKSWFWVGSFNLLVLMMVGCATQKPATQPPTPTLPPQLDDHTSAERAACEQLAAENSRLTDLLTKTQASLKSNEEMIKGLNLRLYEQQTLSVELQKRQTAWQSRLDEAILEVVRAKSRLRSLESKAEAASNLAETEVALQSFKAQRKNGEADAELARAEQLLAMSSDEFKQGNYAGALYLASQARTRLRPSEPHASLAQPAELLPGEEPFAVELPFVLKESSRLRAGPGTDFKALTTLPKGSPIVGVSKKSQWIRVKTKDGASGWVFDALVTRP